MALAFSCQKDSLSGFNSEEPGLRGVGDEGPAVAVMQKFRASYELYEVDALPEEGGLAGMRPPKGYVPRMYTARGSARFLGELSPGTSYEIHYLPPGADLNKDTVVALVWGRFLSRENYESLFYVGECSWYPDGKRESRYEFFRGTGYLEETHGWMVGTGRADEEGAYMKFEAKGRIFVPGWAAAPMFDPS